MNYTKGDWKAYKNALGTWSISTDMEPIAQVERHYNAHLIAAAPDIYEILKELMDRFNGGVRFPLQATCDRANQALAKVAGGK